MGFLRWLFGLPDRDAFARKVQQGLRALGEDRPTRYDPAEFCLHVGGKDGLRLNLGNAYEDFCAAPRSRREGILERYLRAARQAESPPQEAERWEDARAQLRPRVRERSYLDIRRLMLQGGAGKLPGLPHQVLAGHYIVTLVYDLPDSMMEVTDDMLARWNVGFDGALAAARENLWDASRERLKEVSPGVWSAPWQDNYDASRLVLHDLVWQYKVKGEPVAGIPNRDTLLVTGSEDVAGLARLFQLAEEALKKPRPLGGLPLRLEGSEWKPFSLPAGHPSTAALKRLRVLTLGREYGEQKELLERDFERKAQDVFVANFSAVQQKGSGEVSSYCVWSEGVDSLLPETEEVAFHRPSLPEDRQVTGMAPWARVHEVCRDLMPRAGLYPERYRVRKFPSADQLAALMTK